MPLTRRDLLSAGRTIVRPPTACCAARFSGSAVSGRFDPTHSDLDFLVTFEELPSEAYGDAYFGLRDALAGLFGREVDLLTERALENPYLRRRVEVQRQRLFPPR